MNIVVIDGSFDNCIAGMQQMSGKMSESEHGAVPDLSLPLYKESLFLKSSIISHGHPWLVQITRNVNLGQRWMRG